MHVHPPVRHASHLPAMKHTPLLLTLVAASASAAQYGVLHDLNYNRIGVGYESDTYLKSVVVSGEAKLGDYVLVGGSYSDVTGKGSDEGLDGKFSRFGLGVVFNAGPGDLIVRASYGQGNLENADFTAYGVADETSIGVSYRAALGNGFEGELGYARVHTRVAGTNIDAYIKNDNVVKASVRYDITKNIDVTVSYALRSNVVGGNSFGLSAGYSF
jgi:hypothetical protein